MNTYVVGFMFDFAFERVALIRKQKPTWQAGKLKSQEAEQIEILTLAQVIVRRREMIGNLPWHLELARDFATGAFPPRIVLARYGPNCPSAHINQGEGGI